MIRVTPGSFTSHSLRAFNECVHLLPKEKQSLIKIYKHESFMHSLKYALKEMTPKDILLNLPAEKNEFVEGKVTFSGHTDYYRHIYKINELAMCFTGLNSNLLLLTDHIPLVDVTKKLDPILISRKVELALLGLKSCRREIHKIIFLSINPHAGEGGLLGSEENVIYGKVFDMLTSSLPSLQKEIVPSDGHFLVNNFNINTLIVSPYHDQGLSIFKALNGLAGNHLTFGLPYLRMSPIHGTANNVRYNDFNPMGIIYTLLDALKLHD